jgi:hypothetical protein
MTLFFSFAGRQRQTKTISPIGQEVNHFYARDYMLPLSLLHMAAFFLSIVASRWAKNKNTL